MSKIKFSKEDVKEIEKRAKAEFENEEVNKNVRTALESNVDLSDADYAKTHDLKVSEAKRHKRIQSNFFGVQLNFNYQILQSLYQNEILLTGIYQLLEKLDKKLK